MNESKGIESNCRIQGLFTLEKASKFAIFIYHTAVVPRWGPFDHELYSLKY
eukprot:SAG31_NODE_8382_length_1463_cov_1.064516_3_plen_50_part_01